MNYSGKTEKRQKSKNKICCSEFEHALRQKLTTAVSLDKYWGEFRQKLG